MMEYMKQLFRKKYGRWHKGNVRKQVSNEQIDSYCKMLEKAFDVRAHGGRMPDPDDNEFTECNDCTDLVLELKPGDVVSVVEETSRGWFVKHNGTSGWYYGELKMLTEPEDFIPPPKQKKWDNNWQKNLGKHRLKTN